MAVPAQVTGTLVCTIIPVSKQESPNASPLYTQKPAHLGTKLFYFKIIALPFDGFIKSFNCEMFSCWNITFYPVSWLPRGTQGKDMLSSVPMKAAVSQWLEN